MRIWVVGVSDCEGNVIKAICSSQEIAERKLFKARDELVKHWTNMIAHSVWSDDMYGKMIKNLSGNKYKEWNNYPHEVPYIYETELLEA